MVASLAAFPAPLVPLARGYQDLCERVPVLTLVTGHLRPVPVALLLSLAGAAFIAGMIAGVTRLIGTLRFNGRLEASRGISPSRLTSLAEPLGILGRITYVEDPRMVACCYGFLRPRIAITAGLLSRLDQAELQAVLVHERHHVERRDPLRYLVLHALAAAAFMFPATPAVRQRLEARTELAADAAALSLTSHGALAGALLAALSGLETRIAGAAGLTATESRIAHLSGTPALPPINTRALVVSVGLIGFIVTAAGVLTTSPPVVEMVCRFCSQTSS